MILRDRLPGYTVPVTLGHEFAGEIHEVGKRVSGLSVEDSVACETHANVCGRCSYCRSGIYNFCQSRLGFGYGVDAATWLASRQAVAVGSDTQSVEVEPNEDRENEGIVHQILIAKNGIHLIENMKLSELSTTRIYKFLFICIPLKIRCGTGSPVHPLAVI